MRAMSAAAEKVHNSLLTDFCGLQLNSPIVLLSGCVGFGEEYTRVEGFSNRDVGAIVL
jgi:dihydroorotate dehydrogenase (NAD+) catalytic subunit